MKSVIKLVPEDSSKNEGGKPTTTRVTLHLRKNILSIRAVSNLKKADHLLMEVLLLRTYT